MTAIVTLLPMDHAASTREVRSDGVCSSRYVASTGLNTALHTMMPSSAAMMMTSPGTPGRIATRPIIQTARSTPNTRSTLRCPMRAAIGRASRDPTSPPMLGTAKARPYCQAGNPKRPSIRTASSGSVAIIRPLTKIRLKNSGRSESLPRMYRHPSNRSPAFIFCADALCGFGSPAPMARTPHADSRKLTASATTVVTGPKMPISRPPIGGPSTTDDQFVDSKRAFAVSRSSLRTTDFTYAPLAALNAMSAAPSITATTRSWAKVSQPSA
jgi:hypothetical protein